MDMAADLLTVNQWLFSMLLIGGILFLGIFHVIVYMIRKKLYLHLSFGLVCIFYVIWYITIVAPFDLYPVNLLNGKMKQMIAVMCTTQMILYLNIYTLRILQIEKPAYEKGLKIWARTLFLACLFMPFSITYMSLLTFIIQVFNAVAELYIVHDILKVAKKYAKDIRVLNIILFLFTCMTSVIEIFGFYFRDNTILLAFVMLGLQAIILAIHYNQTIIQVEQANVLLEKKVKERTKELVQKEKETIDLISSISHDLRTPITVVSGYMELLQSDGSMDQTKQTYLENSFVRLRQMEKLTEDLFTLSQLKDRDFTLHLEQLWLTELVKRVERLFQVEGDMKGITVKTEIENVLCIADKIRFIQVLDNLMTNALYFATTTVSITTQTNEKMVEIIVTDDGAGIHQDELAYVFDRFYKKRQQGSGIGLNVVKNLVHRMNGKVSVRSELHKGTSFSFTLPLVNKE